MGDVLEETPSSQDDSQPINPTPEHREITNQARIASTIQNANDHDITNRRHPEKASDRAAQIIQDLCLRVQELEGKITDKGKHNNEHGSHATSRSGSRRGRTNDGSVGTIHGDREVAAECDNTSLALRKKSRDAAGVFLADLDARQDGQPRPEPEGDMEKLQIGQTKDEYTFINRNLPYDLKEELSQLLKQNRDLFAFTPANMPGISPDLMSHRLAVDPKAKPIAQRRRKMSPDRATEAGKFLGFMITQRGVEANPEKCRAILEMTSPKNLKDIQRLTGRLTALSRFLGASAQKATPFFKLMKKEAPFKWETECEEAFQHFKRVLAEPPILAKPQTGETLYLYLSITEEALAAALVRENEKKEQKPIYFISKVLQDAEARYSRLEKLAFTLLTASRRLRQYFQAHPVTVRTDQAVKQVLQKPDLAGRMLAWSIELSQFQIKFEPRNAIKAQAMADFIAEMTPGKLTPDSWKLHVDGLSNSTYGGAGVILENQDGITIEQSVRYEFPVSNNQAEYEALLAGLSLAQEVGAKVLEVNTDSQVVSSQINGDYQTRDPLLQQYLAKVNELREGFEHVTIRHVPRERNARADLLSKLASTKPGHGNKSLIQKVVKTPSVSTTISAHLTISNQRSWTYPILQYLLNGALPPDPKEEKRIKREAANYTIVAGQLYKRGFSQPLLKCIEPENTEYILREIHEGCCGHHVGGKTLAQKVIRAGYFWPTVIRDSIQIVKNCDKCQRHANIHQATPHQLSTISAERPFGTWGIDLVGPFPTAPGQLRYLIVAIDYYTKWIEAEPLSSITATQCRKFLWRQIITRFGIPEIVISDNGTQFTDKKFKEFLEGLHLDEAKGLWADELGSVLWSYRTTPQTTTGETPFRLTYGVEAVIPVEIGDPSPRKTVGGNDEEAERDLIDETRSITHLRELALKQRISLRYNHGVIRREFAANDLVLRRNDIGPPTPGEGKLTPNWEGPYRIKAVIGKGAYKLERLSGDEVPRTWNAANLRRYYAQTNPQGRTLALIYVFVLLLPVCKF
nr:uncharacterized protein LOC112733259 [Arachis hypogaea]